MPPKWPSELLKVAIAVTALLLNAWITLNVAPLLLWRWRRLPASASNIQAWTEFSTPPSLYTLASTNRPYHRLNVSPDRFVF